MGSFLRQSLVSVLRKRLIQAGIAETAFSGRSFRKSAAKHAADHGVLDESIQRLGRWTSNAFQLYFRTSLATLYNLNLSFQKGIPPAVPRAKFDFTPTPTHKPTSPASISPYPQPKNL